MKITIHAKNILDLHNLRWYLNRRLDYVFGKYEKQIEEIRVKLANVGRGQGGVDKQCHIHVVLEKNGEVIVEHVESDFFAAINRASEWARLSIESKLSQDFRESLINNQSNFAFDNSMPQMCKI